MPVIVITAYCDSGFSPGERYEALNFQAPCLRAIFGFIGMTNTAVIAVENDEQGSTSVAQSIEKAREPMAQLVAA